MAQTDVEMKDVNFNPAVNWNNAEDQGVTTGTATLEEDTPSTGDGPNPSGSELEAQTDGSPPKEGVKRKTRGEKQPISRLAKHAVSDPEASRACSPSTPALRSAPEQAVPVQSDNLTKPSEAGNEGNADPKPVGTPADSTALGANA